MSIKINHKSIHTYEYKFKITIDLNCYAENVELMKHKIVMRSSEYGAELFANVKNGFGNKIKMEEKWEKNSNKS